MTSLSTSTAPALALAVAPHRPVVAVIVASLGRPEALADLLESLAQQTLVPDRIILSVTVPDDGPLNMSSHPNADLVISPKGSCAQRNAALVHLGADADVVMFLDDDFLPSRFALERAVDLLEQHPDLAGATGHLVADGIHGPGLSLAETRKMIATYDNQPAPPIDPSHDLRGLYGCNMVFRASAIADLRFDERLPLYGWQEDIDFAARARPHGRIVKTFAFAGVHRGLKSGRSPGVRVGYSQVVNPIYLVRKGTMDARYARKIILRNVVANHLRVFRPEAWVDRGGRLRGNWLAMLDLLRGRSRPERILEL